MVTAVENYTLARLRENPYDLHYTVWSFFPGIVLGEMEAAYAHSNYKDAFAREMRRTASDPEVDQFVVAKDLDELKALVLNLYRQVARKYKDGAFTEQPIQVMQLLALHCLRALRVQAQHEVEMAFIGEITKDDEEAYREWVEKHPSFNPERHLHFQPVDYDNEESSSDPRIQVIDISRFH